MSSNTSKGMGRRGSKLCMQLCVNNPELKKRLDEAIGLGKIKWLSPLMEENFQEYELKNLPVERLGLNDMAWSFWPPRQPQWDAIGLAGGKLILVEAKSHCDEVDDPCRSKEGKGRDRIKAAIEKWLGNDEKLMKKYYQIANRLVYLNEIKAIYDKEEQDPKRDVYCVFLYFVDDVTLDGSTREKASKEDWENFLKEINNHIPECRGDHVKEIMFDVWKDPKPKRAKGKQR